jgi:cysteine desulfurase
MFKNYLRTKFSKNLLTKTSKLFTVTIPTKGESSFNMSLDNKGQNSGDPKVKTVFLDFQSTTPVDPRVLDKMLPYLTSQYGNPHSKSHVYGWEAERAVEEARENVAKLIKADAKEIIFTSGATEANNLAIKGVAEFYKDKKKHIITTQTV